MDCLFSLHSSGRHRIAGEHTARVFFSNGVVEVATWTGQAGCVDEWLAEQRDAAGAEGCDILRVDVRALFRCARCYQVFGGVDQMPTGYHADQYRWRFNPDELLRVQPGHQIDRVRWRRVDT